MSCPGVNTLVRVDIYVINASNLDAYEFDIIYPSGELQFMGGAEDQPVTFEFNFLKMNGGSTIGFSCTASSSVVNCANTLVGDQGENTPDGEGILLSIVFKALVECPGEISFGNVFWYDNLGVKDVCTDKGSSLPLPVELSSFTVVVVNETNVALNWETKTEVNNYGFDIQRRTDTDDPEEGWISLGFVEGNGNSNSPKRYSFRDTNPWGGSKFIYRLKQIDTDGKFEYSDVVEIELIPTKYELYQNYPNPFNPNTNIKFSLPEATRISIRVYNTVGEEITEILNKEYEAGYHKVEFNAGNYASGIYFYRLESKSFNDVKKLILIK
jgi:hypothetical protein